MGFAASSSPGFGFAAQVQQIRSSLSDDDQARFDAELGHLLGRWPSEDLDAVAHLIEAWRRVVIARDRGGAAWQGIEERARRDDEHEWYPQARYQLRQTREFAAVVENLPDDQRAALAEVCDLVAREPLPGGDPRLAVEPYIPLPDAFSVPFGMGLLIYRVRPGDRIIELLLPVVYQPLSVWGCGKNDLYALADGTNVSRPLPVRATGLLVAVESIAAGSQYSLSVDVVSNKVFAWGYNNFGQLGDGTTTTRQVPVQAVGLTDIGMVSALGLHSLALKGDGTVWEWGWRSPSSTPAVPAPVPGLANVRQIAAGFDHALALKWDGTVWAWGGNTFGEIGDGSTTTRPAPVQVTALADVTAVAAGSARSMALKADGTVWAWGNNYYAELGDGTTTNRALPVQVQGLPAAAIAIAIDSHGLVVLANGTAWAWGRNANGELGDGMTVQSRPAPGPVSGLAAVTSVAVGRRYSLARTSNGMAWAWGENVYGKLGDGSTTDRHVPVPVSNLMGVAHLAGGDWHTLMTAP